jgi:uncharacterized protein (DUF983 family)
MAVSAAAAASTGKGTMMGRGLTRRGARCGGGKLFSRYLTMVDDCPTCGLHFEREEGYWGGALAINIIATGGLFCIVFVIALVITIPEVPVAPLLAILVPIALFGPIVYYPFSKTVWVAVDRAFLQHLDGNEVADEQHRRGAAR